MNIYIYIFHLIYLFNKSYLFIRPPPQARHVLEGAVCHSLHPALPLLPETLLPLLPLPLQPIRPGEVRPVARLRTLRKVFI